MLRKRSQQPAAVGDLLRQICKLPGDAHFGQTLPPPSMSGQLGMAPIDKVCHITEEHKFSPCWVELRGDVLTIADRGSKKNAAADTLLLKARQISFACQVATPPSALCGSSELKAIATRILAKPLLAVYTPESGAFWLEFDAAQQDVQRWQQHIRAAVEKRDGGQAWTAKQAAYDKLTPLIWRQILTQADCFMNIMSLAQSIGIVDEELTRKDETISGWLKMRVSTTDDNSGSLSPETPAWQDCYCALAENLFLVYSAPSAAVPDSFVCLQFATVTANNESVHAIHITTPITALELRAPDDATLEKWTDAIFALQCSESFSALVPQGLRKQHLMSRIRGKGGDMVIRLLKRANPKRSTSSVELTTTDNAASISLSALGSTDLVDPAAMLKDAKLGPLLQAYAQEQGMVADLQLFANVNDIVGGDLLEVADIELLGEKEKRQLLRASSESLHNKPSTTSKRGQQAATDAAMVQEAYELATRRLMTDLLPRFCETDKFKAWLAQQHEDERKELQLSAMVQSSTGHKALADHLRGKPGERLLMVASRIEELLVTSSRDTPRLRLAEQIVNDHFGDSSGAALANAIEIEQLQVALRAWTLCSDANQDVRDGVPTQGSDAIASRHEFLSILRRILVELHSRLLPSFSSLQSESEYSELCASIARDQMGKIGLMHWLHHPDGFAAMRKWMLERRASESIDFLSEIIKFKRLSDVALTKDAANRIHAKHIAEGALAQIALPGSIVKRLEEGLEPRFPSDGIFDDAVEHVTAFLQQEIWNIFKASSVYETLAPVVHKSLTFSPTPPLLLSVRCLGCVVRHVIYLTKSVITIGRSNCDILLKEAAGMQTSVLQFEESREPGGVAVVLLWNSVPGRIGGSAMRGSYYQSDGNRAAIIAPNQRRFVRYGEAFVVGGVETMVIASV